MIQYKFTDDFTVLLPVYVGGNVVTAAPKRATLTLSTGNNTSVRLTFDGTTVVSSHEKVSGTYNGGVITAVFDTGAGRYLGAGVLTCSEVVEVSNTDYPDQTKQSTITYSTEVLLVDGDNEHESTSSAYLSNLNINVTGESESAVKTLYTYTYNGEADLMVDIPVWNNSMHPTTLAGYGISGEVDSAVSRAVANYAGNVTLSVSVTGTTLRVKVGSVEATCSLPVADASNAGMVSTQAQTFAGDKTFSGTLVCNRIMIGNAVLTWDSANNQIVVTNAAGGNASMALTGDVVVFKS